MSPCTKGRACGPPPPPPRLNGINGTSSWEVNTPGFLPTVGYEVTYTCGNGRKFHPTILGQSEPYETEKKICTWDLTWQPEAVRIYLAAAKACVCLCVCVCVNCLPSCPFQFGRCEWTECFSPPSFEHMSHNWDGSALPFGSVISYACEQSYVFEGDQDRPVWDVACHDDGLLHIDPGMVCVTSKLLPAF